jgi:hypothetical protein
VDEPLGKSEDNQTAAQATATRLFEGWAQFGGSDLARCTRGDTYQAQKADVAANFAPKFLKVPGKEARPTKTVDSARWSHYAQIRQLTEFRFFALFTLVIHGKHSRIAGVCSWKR